MSAALVSPPWMNSVEPTLRHYAALALFAFVGFWLNSWAVPLFDLDEGAFSEATREMFERGDFLMTWLNGEPRYDKPILIYWLQAASVSALGWTEFALRLPSMLSASLWLMAVYRFTRSVGGSPDHALFAAAALALSPIPGLIGHAATADALLNLCLTMSLFTLWQHLADDTDNRWRLARLYFWIGVGVLTKGPIAAVLPVLVGLSHALLHRQHRHKMLQAALFWPGWLLAAALFLPWAVALSLRDGGEFMRQFLLGHNLSRYAATMENHGGHWWYYLASLPLILLPFSAWLPAVFQRFRKLHLETLTGFLAAWFLVVLVVFSASKTQLPHYLLYGCSPLLVLIGLSRDRLRSTWLAALPAIVFLLLLIWLPVLLRHNLPPPRRAYDLGIIEAVLAAFSPLYTLGFCLALGFVLASLFIGRLSAPAVAIRAGLAAAVATWCGVLPLLAAGQQVPVQQAALAARGQSATVVSYRIFMPSFSVYRGAVTPKRAPVAGEVVFTRLDRVAALREDTQLAFTPLYRGGGVVLLKAEAPPLVSVPLVPQVAPPTSPLAEKPPR